MNRGRCLTDALKMSCGMSNAVDDLLASLGTLAAPHHGVPDQMTFAPFVRLRYSWWAMDFSVALPVIPTAARSTESR